ncbi:MAG: cytochrome c oxidase subunit II [Caulobacteraceae bacterium]
MTSNLDRVGRLANGAGLAFFIWSVSAVSALADILGQPTPRAIDMQPAASKIRADQIVFNDYILTPIISIIVILVMVLLGICIVRFNAKAHPVPARWSHNTPLEIAWTGVPILLLMLIAVFSFRLLDVEHDMPKPYMTVKVVGRQWNWDYAYPDQNIPATTSTIMTQQEAKAAGLPYMLAANDPMVVPVGKVVRVLVTGEDVIHSFSMPAFGVKIDAVPGRLNDTWFKADTTGTFFGQCSQLCGIDHAFMPIEIRVVSLPQFNAWVAQKLKPPTLAQAATTAAPSPAAAASPAAR